ncbi:MAG: DnaJ domain-containing protein, partial [Acidimicrobiia bacterium]|nr:DnaJ domain-containing protein [Acidimicrobiia bacterium]
MATDYYKVLGVERDATTEQIKKAFRRIARETHPDANPDDPEAAARFRSAAEAYEVLSDPDRRARYDRGDTIDLTDLFGGIGGLDDLLRSVFGNTGGFGRGAARQARGRDVLVRTTVT